MSLALEFLRWIVLIPRTEETADFVLHTFLSYPAAHSSDCE